MKIERMIEQLKSIAEIAPGADVKLHHPRGNVALFCLCTVGRYDKEGKAQVFIEDESDIDMKNELYAQIEHAEEERIKTIDLIINLLEIGFTWTDFECYLNEKEYNDFLEVAKAHKLIEK